MDLAAGFPDALTFFFGKGFLVLVALGLAVVFSCRFLAGGGSGEEEAVEEVALSVEEPLSEEEGEVEGRALFFRRCRRGGFCLNWRRFDTASTASSTGTTLAQGSSKINPPTDELSLGTGDGVLCRSIIHTNYFYALFYLSNGIYMLK